MFEDLLIHRKGGPEMLAGQSATSLKTISTKEEWNQKAILLKDIYQMLLGEAPSEFRNLIADPKVEKEEIYEGLIKKDISFNVAADERITGYALIPPSAKSSTPAILTLHETSEFGKDSVIGKKMDTGSSTLAYGLRLAKHGYITFSYDQISMGERILRNAKKFETEAFYQRYPNWSVRGKDIFDLRMALDALLSVPLVDSKRIGCMGHSQGGGLTIDGMIFDQRIRAGFSNCGTAPFQSSTNPFGIARNRWWMGIPRLRPFFQVGKIAPIDLHERLALIAPRAFLLISAVNEKCYGVGSDLESNRKNMNELSEEVRKVYQLLDVPKFFSSFQHDEGHSFSESSLNRATDFFNSNLNYE